MQKNKIEKKRQEWIDMAKGLGIICVVFAQIIESDISIFIYIFHMPLFIFIAGYLHKSDVNYKSFSKKKAIRLLLPYFVFLTIIFIPYELVEVKEPFVKALIRYIFGGHLLVKWVGVFWFVTCLFITIQLFNLCTNIFKGIPLFFIVHIFLLLAYIDSFFLNIPIPWAANIVLYAMPIYYWGYIYKNKIEDYPSLKQKIWIYIVSFSLVILAYITRDTVVINMKTAIYGIPIISFTLSLAVIYLIMELMKQMAKIHIFKIFFSRLGTASMIIMYLHQPIQFILLDYTDYSTEYVRFIVALFIPTIFYFIIKNNKISRTILLGEVKFH